MSILVTLPNLKSYLGIPAGDTSTDGMLTVVLQGVSAAIETWCGRTFGSATYTEFYCGDGSPWLVLNQRPVSSVTSLYVDDNAAWGDASGAFAATTLLTEGVNFALRRDSHDGLSGSGMVYNLDGTWPATFNYMPGRIASMPGPGLGNIKVTYVAGYATAPADVQLACHLQVAAVRNSKNTGQVLASESTGDSAGSMSYQTKMEPKVGMLTREVTSLLARWRNVACW